MVPQLSHTCQNPANKTITLADGKSTMIIHYTTAPCTITCLDSNNHPHTGILTFGVIDLQTPQLSIGWPDLTNTFYQLFIDLIQSVHALHITNNNTPEPMHTGRSNPVGTLCSLSDFGHNYVTPLHELLKDPLWSQYNM